MSDFDDIEELAPTSTTLPSGDVKPSKTVKIEKPTPPATASRASTSVEKGESAKKTVTKPKKPAAVKVAAPLAKEPASPAEQKKEQVKEPVKAPASPAEQKKEAPKTEDRADNIDVDL